VHLTDEGLNSIEKAADKQKNVCLLFLIDIYRMLKILVEKQNNTGNGGNYGTDSANDSEKQS
jgi:hypothetical protein